MKRFIAVMLIPVVLLSACAEEEGTEQGAQPVMPPSASMAPDFEAFGSTEAGGRESVVLTNWSYAAINVGVYSAILYQHLVIPVTAFKMTIGTSASFDAESQLWIWEKSFTVPDYGDFKVKLTASVDGTDVDWTGYISQGTVLDGFVWFEGDSKLDGSSGSWTLYESPENQSAWLSSSWERVDDSEQANVTFTVEKEGESQGSTISYAVDAEADLDLSVMIFDAAAQNNVDVWWSSTDAHGQVMSEAYFNDTEYHCWDASLLDTVCE